MNDENKQVQGWLGETEIILKRLDLLEKKVQRIQLELAGIPRSHGGRNKNDMEGTEV